MENDRISRRRRWYGAAMRVLMWIAVGLTGCFLSIGRILGESAALLYTAGFAHAINGLWGACAAPERRSPWRCMSMPRRRANLAWPLQSPPF